MKKIKLNNGVEMPILGFGTYKISDPKIAEESVKEALNIGYRLIDTAQSYMNEEAVGKGIRASKVDRKEIFITTKIWVENVSYDGVMKSFNESLRKLNLDYIDLLLIHQPYNDVYGAWKAMQELLEQKKVRAIGVSNFSFDKILDLKIFNKVSPMINQIEINPFYQRKELINSLKQENIVPEAWAPFAEGKNDIFNNEILINIARNHNKSVAQIILRWLIEQDIIVLAKTTNPDRMKENFDIFDFELSNEEKLNIAQLDINKSQFFSHSDPEIIRWMASRKIK